MNTINHKICNYGFCLSKTKLTPEQIKKIKNDLTVTPESNFGNFLANSFTVYKNTPNYYIVPIYYGLQDLKIKDYTVNFPEETVSSSIQNNILLRDNQKDCFQNCINEFKHPFGGGIITLNTGMGKTVVSLKIIAHSQKKTLVIVNKVELLNQWKKEIEKWIPDAKIGIIQGSKFEYEDCHIVLGMLQSIAIKKNIKVIDFTWVENCIIDECHNISSEVFSNIMFKVRPRYIFGLTATLERKDKLEKVIKWYLGDTLYDGSNKNLKQSTQIYVLKYFGNSSVEKYLRDGTAAVATMLSNISTDITRSNYIIGVLKNLIEADPTRNILVISDRIAQLKYIHTKLPEDSGLFIGSMKSSALDISKQKRIVLGTYPLVNEGFNLPKLNCLLFATPRSSITQAIGRIYRKTHDSVTPVIIDIMDDFSIFKGQHYRRRKIYKTSIYNCVFISQQLEKFSIVNHTHKVIKFELDSDNDSDNDNAYDLANKILSKKCLLED